MFSDAYPTLRKISLNISYDNGGINRDRPEKTWNQEFDVWLKNLHDSDAYDLGQLEASASLLTPDQIDDIATGDDCTLVCFDSELVEFIEKFFDEVC